MYQLIPVTKEIMETITLLSDVNCFDYCDAYREKFATYLDQINKWVIKDGGGFFYGCVCN